MTVKRQSGGMELWDLAAKESDPNKLMKFTEEIVRLLDEKRKPPLASHSRTPQDRSPTYRPDALAVVPLEAS